ncbi:AraC family transcriptional regulator [Mucilaginibacter sp. KACC 22063]|uniref:AraC family transcriptional regulator n=1 Tax=Mucilaginibacter sp. KACC 22063 TaxID=3025666 RepID=UPI002366EC70|nr:AraC family transcriptional regulator [Mucilaginibacter sp. KACC 22063]WDF55858.1 AraC family transcriptional regulator [Mucilaginibacter sp. KACC 22063]
MKVLQFTIPVPHDKSVITEHVYLPFHYPYLHRHKEIQLTWIKRGEGTLIAGTSMHDYIPGDLFLIGANLPHVFKSNPEYFTSNSEKMVEALTIFFDPEGTLSSLFNLPELKPCLMFLQQHYQGLKVPSSLISKISQLMTNLQKASRQDQLVYFIQILKTFSNIKCKMQPLSTFGKLPNITDNDGIKIGKIYNYIIQNYGEPIALDEVAEIAHMTPESFCRYFKKHTGQTFTAFLNDVRINEACKKLISHKFESINIVAYKCGFKSVTNFNRVFRSITGNSPRTYLDCYNNNIISIKLAVS